MFRASQLYHVPIYIACAAAGAGGTWYFTRVASPTPAQQSATAMPPPVRTVSWFEAHPSEMRQKFAACNDNPGGAMADPECVNASDANDHVSLSRMLRGAPK